MAKSHVMFQVSGTTQYLQVKDDHVVSADQLDGNDKDNVLYTIRELKIKDERPFPTMQIGRDNQMWLQVKEGKITVGEKTTHFGYEKNGSEIKFTYSGQYVAYDLQQHTLVLISKDQSRQRQSQSQRHNVMLSEFEKKDLDDL